MKSNYDVIVVGAGPAGAVLAYELAKRRFEVLLLEKEKLPRYKCCAGGVTKRAARLLDFDVSQLAEDVVYEISFSFDLAGCYQGRYSQPLIYTVSRDAFDYFLASRARERGAALLDGHAVTGVEIKSGGVEVIGGGEVFRSPLVAGADGVRSSVARKLGITGSRQYLAAVAWELVVSARELNGWKSRARIDWGCVPGGYAWVFPKRDHLAVGIGCPIAKAKNLTRNLRRFLDSLAIYDYEVKRSGVQLIPTCGEGSYVFRDRALLLGDAAGFADPLTGEGIYYAIRSAQLAAPVIEDFLRKGEVGLEKYQEIVNKEIVAELTIARKASRVLAGFPRLALELLSRSEEAWSVIGGLMSGDLNYAIIEQKVGGLGSIFKRLP